MSLTANIYPSTIALAGNPIKLNPGKTFFEVVSDAKTVTFE